MVRAEFLSVTLFSVTPELLVRVFVSGSYLQPPSAYAADGTAKVISAAIAMATAQSAKAPFPAVRMWPPSLGATQARSPAFFLFSLLPPAAAISRSRAKAGERARSSAGGPEQGPPDAPRRRGGARAGPPVAPGPP